MIPGGDSNTPSPTDDDTDGQSDAEVTADEFFTHDTPATDTTNDGQVSKQNDDGQGTAGAATTPDSSNDNDDGKEEDDEKTSDWTTVSIKRDTYNRLESLASKSTAQSKDVFLTTILDVLNDIHIEGDPETTLESVITETPPAGTHHISGVQITTETGVHHHGFSPRNKHVIIEDATPPTAPVQPLPRAQYKTATIYCPACGDTIGSYSLSPVYPYTEHGVFSDASWWCSTCDKQRPSYTLFATQPSVNPSPDVLETAATQYIAHVLIGQRLTETELHNRINHCHGLAEDGGWDWLPDVRNWLGFQATGGIEVTPHRYIQFIAGYITYQLTDGLNMSTVDCQPQFTRNDSAGESTDAYWGVRIEFNSDVHDKITNYITELCNTWRIPPTMTETTTDTFAAHAIDVDFTDAVVSAQEDA